MISVVIPTANSERRMLPTLAALVPGSAEGLLREVLLVDGGSTDDTATIADAAGCEFLRGSPDEGSRLAAGAGAARGDWLLFLDPGAVLDNGWTREVGAFVASSGRAGQAGERAATFRLAIDDFGMASRLAETAAALQFAILRRPDPRQGLLIAKRFYAALGGHPPGPRARQRLHARIGRRIVGLRTRIVLSR